MTYFKFQILDFVFSEIIRYAVRNANKQSFALLRTKTGVCCGDSLCYRLFLVLLDRASGKLYHTPHGTIFIFSNSVAGAAGCAWRSDAAAL
jgi:hypothetical protein